MNKRVDHFTYPCGIRLMFSHAYNPHEFEQINEDSHENVKALWHVQKLANQPLRLANTHHIIQKPNRFNQAVKMHGGMMLPSLKQGVLSLKAPYEDHRSAISPIFDSFELVAPSIGPIVMKQLMVTFCPQHQKYTNNVIEHLLLHFTNQLSIPDEYNNKVFHREHIKLEKEAKWHVTYRKAFVLSQMQKAFTQQELLFTMAEFDLDMSKVHEDEAYKALMEKNQDDISVPTANPNASQNLSMLNSLKSVDDYDMDETPFLRPPNPVILRVSYASKASIIPASSNMSNQKLAAKGNHQQQIYKIESHHQIQNQQMYQQ